jgi:hypothetical protein
MSVTLATMVRRPAVALMVALPLLLAACDGDDGGGDTPTTTVETPGTTAEATLPPEGIRALDLRSSEAVQDLLDVTGGLYVQDNVLYTDLTGDGDEEAVVPVSSGGTLGDVGFIVLTEAEGALEALLTATPQTGGVSVVVVDGKVFAVEAVPGPDDPECCPSQLRTTVYAWDGEELAVESSTVEPAADQ